MFKNYIKIAWRSLKKQPFLTSLNVFGLAIGVAGALLISLYIHDELSFDTMFADLDRIYRIDTDIKFGGAEFLAAASAPPMAATMQRDFSQIEATVRFREEGSTLLRRSTSETSIKESHITFADSTFFDFFGLELLVGDTRTALTAPNTLVLTQSAAKRHFGSEKALGETLVLDDGDIYTVTGVIADFPKNSFLREYTVFMAMAGNVASRENIWGSQNYNTFVKLIPNADPDDFREPLQGMVGKYMLPWAQKYFPGMTAEKFEASGNYIRYYTMPLADIHLYGGSKMGELSANGSIHDVYILSFVALFLIILASVNFMNLSTAHSLRRAKEVGVRKTLGSNKIDLVRHFLTESGLMTLIALLIALLITVIALPFFNELSGKSMTIPYTNPLFWMLLLGSSLILGLFSGSYPAFFMSRFNPVKTLKGSKEGDLGGSAVRNSLVVFQFSISIFLIVATLVVFQQLEFIQAKDLGFSKDQVLIVEDTYVAGAQEQVFRDEVQKLSQVTNATLTDFLPTPSTRSNGSYFPEGKLTQENAIHMQTWEVDHQYLPTLDIALVAGRNFSKAFATDSTAVIINESTLPVLGVNSPEEALGMRITQDADLEEKVYHTIVGVIKDFHYQTLREDIGALGLFMDTSSGMMAVKVNAGDFSNTITAIEGIWNQLAPGKPFSYRFMDDAFNSTYEAEQRLSKIFIVFTILSILIACLGLFGLATFNAQKRTKEIGIRKVLGANVGQITYRLIIDFLKMVGIAILISLPLGWYAMNIWLEDFSYRVEINIWVFVVAAVLAVGIAMITVSYQSIKAAVANPVQSLRTE